MKIRDIPPFSNVKVEAADELLLGEGVCRQLKIITYHPSVSSKKTRKENRIRPMPNVKPQTVDGEAAVLDNRPNSSVPLEKSREVKRRQQKPDGH